MADSQGSFESIDKSNHNGIDNFNRPSLSHLQNISLSTPYSSSSVEPASIVDSRESISESDSPVSLLKLLKP